MFRKLIDTARVVGQFIKRIRDEFAEAQQHLVPVGLAAATLLVESTRWL